MQESDTNWDEWELCIRIAGNTAKHCIFAIWQKGYSVRHYYPLREDGEYQTEFDAKKDGRLFSATSPEELLGLIALWETRGDSWRDSTEAEQKQHSILEDAAPTYNIHGEIVAD